MIREKYILILQIDCHNETFAILNTVLHKCSPNDDTCHHGGVCEAVNWIYQCNCIDHHGPKCGTGNRVCVLFPNAFWNWLNQVRILVTGLSGRMLWLNAHLSDSHNDLRIFPVEIHVNGVFPKWSRIL